MSVFCLILSLAPFLGGDPGAAPVPSVPLPTLGGKQFWADELFFHGWRIQRNVLTEHCRLLDPADMRHASGSYDHCRKRLDEIKRDQGLVPMRGRAVVMLHGLGRSRASMDKLSTFLRDRGGFAVFNVSYPTTQADFAAHARSLAKIVEHLDGIEEISFVGHSMGNLVVRHYLGDQTDPAQGRRPDPRIKRFVMLAPPNHGAVEALMLADNGAFRVIAGKSGQELGRDWDRLEKRLATPACPFGILAGGKGDGRGYNPILLGDNDGTISVATARLAGAADFAVLPVLHSFITEDPKAMEYTLRFLEHGYFVSAEKREPLGGEEKGEGRREKGDRSR